MQSDDLIMPNANDKAEDQQNIVKVVVSQATYNPFGFFTMLNQPTDGYNADVYTKSLQSYVR